MSQAYRRKKNPELVRQLLIQSAIRHALENGLGRVSVEAVAFDAGVTKGGLFHHFPSKQALIDAVFQYLLQEYEAELKAIMSADPGPYGRFTRAYVRSVFDVSAPSRCGTLWMATLTASPLRQVWATWFNLQVSRYGETSLQLENARFAADGIWLGHMSGVVPDNSGTFLRYLIEMTRLEK